MELTLEVNRVCLCGSEDGKEAGYKYKLIVAKCTLQWANIEFVQETELAADFPEHEIQGPGSYIYCKGGFSIYCQNDYQQLAAKFVQWQQSAQAAQQLHFKAN